MSDLLFATIGLRYSQSRSNFKFPEVFNPNQIFYEVTSNALLLLYNFMQNDELPHLFKSKWCFDHQYYNLPYNPSAPFVCSGFLVSYRIRSAIKTTATRTAPHLKYIQGISIPNKASFEILAMNTGLNRTNRKDKAKWRSIEASNNVNKHTGHGLLAVDSPSE